MCTWLEHVLLYKQTSFLEFGEVRIGVTDEWVQEDVN